MEPGSTPDYTVYISRTLVRKYGCCITFVRTHVLVTDCGSSPSAAADHTLLRGELTAVSLLHIGTDGFGGSREIAKRNSCPILKRKRFEMHTLYILMLGVVLGAGLVQLPTAIARIVERRRLLKAIDFDARVDAEIRKRELDRWGIVTSAGNTAVDLTGWGTIPESEDRPRSTPDTSW